MGLSISWIAVKGKENLFGELGLAPTDERDELPAESPIAGVSLDDGWYAVIFDRYDHGLIDDGVLKRLSEECEVVAAGAEEHVMSSFATGWHNGEQIWWIAHDAQEGLYDLEAKGSLPDGFDQLRRERLEEQEAAGGGVDYIFEIPLEAAKLVTGFSYAETEPDDGFAVLRYATT
jgi:hypothetical protein